MKWVFIRTIFDRATFPDGESGEVDEGLFTNVLIVSAESAEQAYEEGARRLEREMRQMLDLDEKGQPRDPEHVVDGYAWRDVAWPVRDEYPLGELR